MPLNRPYLSVEIPRKLYRGEFETWENGFLEIKRAALQDKALIINRGFIATSPSKSKSSGFGAIKTTFIEVSHWNPTAKNISPIENTLFEYESLIPPGQEIRYIPEKNGSWKATLFSRP
ncbi:MAG: hypothetical protein JSR33_11260 [Proteobacteria bacterium]|nr:hypothetical protein [Pseudomonadota bacterium]